MFHTLLQRMRGNINKFYFVRVIQDTVRKRFPHSNSSNASDTIIQTFQVLYIQCCDHINSSIQNFLDILIAFSMFRASNIGMGKLIN